MKHIDTIERPESTTRIYAFDYHVIANQQELKNIFDGYTGGVIVDGRSVRPEDFQPYVLFRLDNGMRYHLDMSIVEDITKLPFDVKQPNYFSTDYFQGLE